MEPAHDEHGRRRENLLTIFLTLIGATLFLCLMIAFTGGFFFYVVTAVAALGLLGSFHYWLWGRAMTQNTAGEREEQLLREQAEENGWPLPDPSHPRDS
jgi:nicotinamide riboside transporter PnuC